MTYHSNRSMVLASVFGALLTTVTISTALAQDDPQVLEGDVQRKFLEAKGVVIPPATEEAVSNEQLCRELALRVFIARDKLHNEAEMLEVADLIDQSAQVTMSTQIYLDLGCSGERLLPQDVYVAGEDRPYFIGRRPR